MLQMPLQIHALANPNSPLAKSPTIRLTNKTNSSLDCNELVFYRSLLGYSFTKQDAWHAVDSLLLPVPRGSETHRLLSAFLSAACGQTCTALTAVLSTNLDGLESTIKQDMGSIYSGLHFI